MSKFMVVFSMCVLAAILPGCIAMAPAYPKELLTFDEELLGTWRARAKVDETQNDEKQKDEKQKDEKPSNLQIVVERREARLVKGRLSEAFPREDKGATLPAYRIKLSEANGEDPAKPSLNFDAVLLKIDGVTLIAMQISPESPGVKDSLGWVLPVHRVLKLERSGNSVRVSRMKHDLVWMPLVEPIDPPGDSVSLPEKGSFLLITNDDRYIRFLKAAVAKPDYWEPPKTEIERVP